MGSWCRHAMGLHRHPDTQPGAGVDRGLASHNALLHIVTGTVPQQHTKVVKVDLMVQAMQQSSYYMGLQRHPGMALMPGLPLPGMQPAPMHVPMIGYQYRPAYGHGAPMQSVVSVDGSTLRLRGLPYSAGVEEISEFFSGGCFAAVCPPVFLWLPEQHDLCVYGARKKGKLVLPSCLAPQFCSPGHVRLDGKQSSSAFQAMMKTDLCRVQPGT